MRRQFLKPLLVVLSATIALMAVALHQRSNSGWLQWVAGMVMLVLDVGAVALDGIWMALVCRTHTRATLATVLRVLALPWVGFGAVVLTIEALQTLEYLRSDDIPTGTLVGIWFFSGLVTDAVFGWRAWRRLQTEFRATAMQQYGVRAERIRPAAPARRPLRWRPALAVAIVLLAGAYMVFGRSQPRFTPPVAVTLSQSNAPLRVFPGWNGGVFLILPDQSLWRWGQPDGPGFRNAAMPEMMGTNRDWVKVALLPGPRIFALRTNGTTWEWGVLPNGRFTNTPVQRNFDTDWKDIAVTPRYRVGLKQDGTLWGWGPPLGTRTNMSRDFRRLPEQVGTATNWSKIVSVDMGMIGLQSNGTFVGVGQHAALHPGATDAALPGNQLGGPERRGDGAGGDGDAL